MDRKVRPFSLLIKPASADCNLRCAHCFYLDRAGLYPTTKAHRMPDDVLERMIAGYMATPQPQYLFGWQGGEPTLMGVDFFKKATVLQERFGHPGVVVGNGLQTNATLIDDELAEHFGRYKFLLGVSLDGPREQHDHYRRDLQYHGSYTDAWRGIELLRRHNVSFNILTLVTKHNVSHAGATYRYLCDNGFKFHQYIPCVEFGPDGTPLPFTVSGEEWGLFLCDLFDAWIAHDTRRISIRLFDAILARLVDGQSIICHMSESCCQYFVVEYNGDVYPCDFFVTPDLRLGNVMTDTWAALLDSPKYREFGDRKRHWNALCAKCEWVPLCAGDCLKHRLHGRDSATLGWLCDGWKVFFRHTMKEFQRLAALIAEERKEQRATGPDMAPTGPGRNDPCPCGSGLKYKKCCMASETDRTPRP